MTTRAEILQSVARYVDGETSLQQFLLEHTRSRASSREPATWRLLEAVGHMLDEYAAAQLTETALKERLLDLWGRTSQHPEPGP